VISIVIPAYKEDSYLQILLESIKKQDFEDYEILVCSDNLSKSAKKTVKKYRCIAAKGGKPGQARNNGAKLAKYDLLFLDADVILPEGFLKRFMHESALYDIMTCRVLANSKKFSHNLYYSAKNFLNRYNPIPHCSGQCIFIRRQIFEAINGYDETLVLGEEHDLLQRAKKTGSRFKFSDSYVLNSPRRIVKEGFFGLTAKSLYSEFYRMFKPVRKRIFEYDYEHEKIK
jgi:glycosyltransferase involved in cell wall biosynthesis